MITLESKRNYKEDVLMKVGIMLAAVMLLHWWKDGKLWIDLLLFFTPVIYLLSTRFTHTILIDSSIVTIRYYRFLTPYQLQFPRTDARVKLKQAVGRSGAYLELLIYEKTKLVYAIDSRDGFEDQALKELEIQMETDKKDDQMKSHMSHTNVK